MTTHDLTLPANSLSVVNFAYDDPMGSPYRPPANDRHFWLDPAGNRVTTSDVQAGADPDTRLLVYLATMNHFRAVYDAKAKSAIANNKIFRGGDVEHLLAELRGQLSHGHWA